MFRSAALLLLGFTIVLALPGAAWCDEQEHDLDVSSSAPESAIDILYKLYPEFEREDVYGEPAGDQPTES